MSAILMLGLMLALVFLLRPLGAAPALQLEQVPAFATTTLHKYLGRSGDEYPLIVEVASRDQVMARIFKRCRKDWQGGAVVEWPLVLDRINVAEFADPYKEVTLVHSAPVRRGNAPIRFLQWGWYISKQEMRLNRPADVMLNDISKIAQTQVANSLVESVASAGWARHGNYAHDTTGEGGLIPLNPFYYCTIDGNHVTGSGSVAGLNPATYPEWKNPYISPVASSDGLGTITSIHGLKSALQRMLRLMKFDDVAMWGALAEGASNTPSADPDGPEGVGDLMLVCDDRTELAFRDVMFEREDNVGYDQYRGRPVFKRMMLYGDSHMRMSPYGWGYDNNGNALWPDRGSSYASANWPDYGLVMVLNTRYYHVAVDPQNAPYLKPAYVPQGRFGLAHEGQFWYQQICRSRQRGLGWIGPFDTSVALAA